MSDVQKAIRVLIYMNIVVWLTLFLFIRANSLEASGQTIPQHDDVEFALVTQVWLPVVFGGGE